MFMGVLRNLDIKVFISENWHAEAESGFSSTYIFNRIRVIPTASFY